MDVRKCTALPFDFDGIIWSRDRPLSGAREALAELHTRWRNEMIASINAQLPGTTISSMVHLATDIYISALPVAVIAVSFIETALGGSARLTVVGGPVLVEEFAQSRLRCVPIDNPAVDAALLGCTPSLDYQETEMTSQHAEGRATLFCANDVVSRPAGVRKTPATGALVPAASALCSAPWTVLGKLEPPRFELALSELGPRPEETLFVGDGLEMALGDASRNCIGEIRFADRLQGGGDERIVGAIPTVSQIHLEQETL